LDCALFDHDLAVCDQLGQRHCSSSKSAGRRSRSGIDAEGSGMFWRSWTGNGLRWKIIFRQNCRLSIAHRQGASRTMFR
jgi:hypothetical protein